MENVKEQINNILTKIEKQKNELAKNEENQKTKDDYFYWQYVREATENEKEISKLEDELYDLLKLLDLSFIKKYEELQNRLNTIVERKDKTIADLDKYKPNGYKQAKKFIEDLGICKVY